MVILIFCGFLILLIGIVCTIDYVLRENKNLREIMITLAGERPSINHLPDWMNVKYPVNPLKTDQDLEIARIWREKANRPQKWRKKKRMQGYPYVPDSKDKPIL